MITDSGKIWWARMAIKDTGPWVALAFSYIHISTGNSNLKEYFEISFWWKSNILPYFPTKAPWFQLYRGADFPTDRGCQDFDRQTSTVSHEIFRVHLSPPSHISALTKGLPLSFLFHSFTTKSWQTSYEKFHLSHMKDFCMILTEVLPPVLYINFVSSWIIVSVEKSVMQER